MYANHAGIKKIHRLLQLRIALEPRFDIAGGELTATGSVFLGRLCLGFCDRGLGHRNPTTEAPSLAEDLHQRFEHVTARQLLQAKFRVRRCGKHDFIGRAPTGGHPLQERCNRWSARVNRFQDFVPHSQKLVERQRRVAARRRIVTNWLSLLDGPFLGHSARWGRFTFPKRSQDELEIDAAIQQRQANEQYLEHQRLPARSPERLFLLSREREHAQ